MKLPNKSAWIICASLLLICASSAFARSSSVNDERSGTHVVSSGFNGTMTGDLEMGNTPYSIDGGTGGLTFDPDNDGTNEVTIDTAGQITADGGFLAGASADPSLIFNTLTATDTDFWLGVQEDAGGDDDDFLAFGDGLVPGTNTFGKLNTSGQMIMGGSFAIMEAADFGNANRPIQTSCSGATEPLFTVWSTAEADSTDWMHFCHSGSNAFLEVGSGSLIVDVPSGASFQIQASSTGNPILRLLGYITAASGTTNITWQINDVNDAVDVSRSSNRLRSLNTKFPRSDSVDAQTCADSGNGSPGALTLVPTTSYSEITVADADGCNVTLSEVDANSLAIIEGFILDVVNVSAANTATFTDSDGVQELNTAGAAVLGPYDTMRFRYIGDRWVEISRSDNEP